MLSYFSLSIVKLISFNQLCTTLNFVQEPQKLELLKSLQQVAELVQGNWVVKSEILYPSGDKDKPVKLCGLTGIHPDIISKARDYVVRIPSSLPFPYYTLTFPFKNSCICTLLTASLIVKQSPWRPKYQQKK